MSSDMLTHLIDKDIENKKESFKDIEIRRWMKFSNTCDLKINDNCIFNDKSCKMETCFAKIIIQSISLLI